MRISFNQVPAASRVPFFFVEFDASRAGGTDVPFRSLLVGQKIAAGRAAEEALVRLADVDQAVTEFGRGSQLHRMAAAFRRQNPLGELYAIAAASSGATAAQTATVTIGAAASGSGTLALYVGGNRVAVPVKSGDDVNTVASAIKAQVDADPDLPVTATVSNAIVTLTNRTEGVSNVVEIKENLLIDDATPPGVEVTIADGTAAAGDADPAGALTAVAAEAFDIVAMPGYPAATVTATVAELAERWDAASQVDGLAIMSYRGADGTQAQATTYGDTLNSPYLCVADGGGIPNPDHEIAAALAGAVSRAAEIDPARPFQTLPLRGVLGRATERTLTERNNLLKDGISTIVRDAGGVVRIERLITTYQTNPQGGADTAYLNANTPLTLSYIRRDFRQYIQAKYPRHKLADDGTRIGPGQAVITPKVGRAEAVARFRQWEERGLVEGAEQFKEDLVVERNADDRDRLDWLMSPDLVNQFRVGGAKIAFIL